MACSLLRNLALVGIGLVLGAGWSAFGEPAPRQYWHEGRAIEHEARKPLDASVVAWPEMKRSSMNGSCPAYGSKALDTQTSHDGAFKLSIDQSQRTYTLVYCLNDFVPRIDFMPNRRNGTAVGADAGGVVAREDRIRRIGKFRYPGWPHGDWTTEQPELLDDG